MITVDSIEKIPQVDHPIALTIGVFDGIHLGHQLLLNELIKLSKKGTSVVFTFSNHPSTIINPDRQIQTLMSREEKASFFTQMGIDLLIIVPFTKELSNLSYSEFITKIRNQLPFDHLLLGKGASFGKNQEGNEKNLTPLAKKLGFNITYLKKLSINKETVSSGAIRRAIASGDKTLAEKLLGHRVEE